MVKMNKHCLRMLFRQASSFHGDEKLSKFSYWKAFYERKSQAIGFDWFLDSHQVLGTVLESIENVFQRSTQLPKERQGKGNILSYLDLGCGTSELPSKVFMNCPHATSLVLLDFIPEALTYQLNKMLECKPLLKDSTCVGIVADVQKLPFASDTFNIIVDKGTMDALLKDKSRGHHKTQLMMSEVVRVLAPGGRYLQISDEDPDSRLLFLEQTCDKSHNSSHSLPESNTEPCIPLPPLPRSALSSAGKTKWPEFILPAGRLLNKTDLAKYNQNIVHAVDELSCESSSGLGDTLSKPEDFTTAHISPWSFQVLLSPSDTEFFVYWTDKKL
ncbi:citrate synthase-lysine N-methyltransferase CSKMT, mitochondrial-like [Biomphalaria glabrata]|uniref:Citrate synthase-lysine N-methyltransferase CSKMT, mitochondrial-like n=1 Tax=Biomphalaria glabrata TaxID=6526 RepID=A0A9W2ZUL1_BIOGL|nr:citrate synthase-lysine N-methyltransferase CSKMT, mitochondrial-like [Biomphalaria glabrata]